MDRNVFVDRLVFEDRAYIVSRDHSAGGRGINASLVLHSFGVETLAIVTSGGKNGEKGETQRQRCTGLEGSACPLLPHQPCQEESRAALAVP